MTVSRVLFYTIFVSLGGFIFGFDASVISGAVNFIVAEFNLTPIELGFVVSAPTLGATIAIFAAGPLSDRYGRRRLLQYIAVLYLLSAVFSALATSYWVLVIARFIGGLAFCSLMVAPMYIAEIATAKSRGRMVSINQLNIVIGFSAAYFANYFIFQASEQNGAFAQSIGLTENIWRYMLGLEILPAMIWFVLLWFIPESPRWQVLKGKSEQAKQTLLVLRGNEAQAAEEIQFIKSSLTEEQGSLIQRVKSLFGKKMRLALAVGLVVGIAQQLSGINAIFFYAPNIFEQSGIGTNAAFSQAVYVGLINVAFTLLAMMFIDRLGRKPLLVIGLSGVALSMLICAYGFSKATYQITEQGYQLIVAEQQAKTEYSATGGDNAQSVVQLEQFIGKTFEDDVTFKATVKRAVGDQTYQNIQSQLMAEATNMNATVILVGILAFVAAFAFSLGPVMWVLFSEIFPNHLRGVAVSFVSVINSLMSFIVTMAFPVELERLGAATTMSLYGLSAIVGLVFVLKFLPETKGKSLEQIEQELHR